MRQWRNGIGLAVGKSLVKDARAPHDQVEIRTGAKRLPLTRASKSQVNSLAPVLTRCLYTALAIVSFILCGCSRTQSVSNPTATTEVFSSTPPFKTLEPDRYQAIRVLTFTNTSGSSDVTRTLIAKDGLSRREETLGPNAIVYLYLSQGMFSLVPDARIYSDSNPITEPTTEASVLEESSEFMLHEGGSETLYRQLGHEDVDGRRSQKYQVVVNRTSVTNVTNSDTFVWVDEELGMPIKTETKSANGNRTVIEFTQIKRDVDSQLFQIPVNYRKVTREELRQRLSNR